jgi:hypothetical protein
LLRAFPTMSATVIAERVGWSRSIRTLSGRVAELRPAYLPPDPAGRTSYAPGERLLPLAVRAADPDPAVGDLFAGWWQLITALAAVPRVLVWDLRHRPRRLR